MRLARSLPLVSLLLLVPLGCAPRVLGGGGAGAPGSGGSPGTTGRGSSGSPAITDPGPGGSPATGPGAGGLPATTGTLPGQVQLRAGADDTCVISAAGHVACWGSNETGQLGLGDRVDRRAPAWIPSLSGVTDLAVADFAMCAREIDGSLWCWGMNAYGELGGPTSNGCPGLPYACSTLPLLSPAQPPGTLVAGSNSLCSVAPSPGGIQCWGGGAAVDAGAYHALSAAAGYFQVCVRFAPGAGQDPDRNVVCFGNDDDGELGVGVVGGTGPVVAGVTGGFVELAAGDDFTCGVGADGEVLCWGQNVYAALGQAPGDQSDTPDACPGDGACSRRPVLVAGLPPVAHVAARFEQACAATQAGEVYCWGTPSRTSPASAGECSPSAPDCAPTPTLVPGVEGAVQIAVGAGHACALTSAGEVICWGLDTHGQLGRGSGGPAWDPTPQKVVLPPEPM